MTNTPGPRPPYRTGSRPPRVALNAGRAGLVVRYYRGLRPLLPHPRTPCGSALTSETSRRRFQGTTAAYGRLPPAFEHPHMIDPSLARRPSLKSAACGPTADPASVESRPRGRRLRAILEHELAWWEAVLAYGPDHPALVSTRDIAEAMYRKPQTVRLWRMLGRMPPPVIVGGRLRHVRRDVQVWALACGRDPSRLTSARR
jgi:hypothetical protein